MKIGGDSLQTSSWSEMIQVFLVCFLSTLFEISFLFSILTFRFLQLNFIKHFLGGGFVKHMQVDFLNLFL